MFLQIHIKTIIINAFLYTFCLINIDIDLTFAADVLGKLNRIVQYRAWKTSEKWSENQPLFPVMCVHRADFRNNDEKG